MNEYKNNLKAFKDLLDKYTIADLESMINHIPVKESGACCYPAIQTIISMMEMLGKLIRDKEGIEAINVILTEMGSKYSSIIGLDQILYDLFRNGIAHNSLAKAGVFVRKSGTDDGFHLSNNGKNIDVKLFFNDFKTVYEELFTGKLIDSNSETYYERNLKKVLSELGINWEGDRQSFTPSTTTFTTTSGVMSSGASGVAGPIKETHTP